MKALLLSISLDGGAGGAPYRLHQSLKGNGTTSQILVDTKNVDDESVIAVPKSRMVKLATELARLTRIGHLDRLPLRLYPKRDHKIFSLQWVPDSIEEKAAQLNPDVINLHWICSGFLRIETISRFSKPLIWTLHDMWAFTGGCHHSDDCNNYMDKCGCCPQLHSNKRWDLSYWIWRRKKKAWGNLNLTVVAPSSWLAKCAKASSLFKDFRIEVIPNGIDIQRYRPMTKEVAREILGLTQDKKIVLFGAWHNVQNKGFHLLQSALRKLNKSWSDKMQLVVFGFSRPDKFSDLGMPVHFLGKLNDEITMSLVYSAADVFVAPSLQDNLPTTVMEATSCGTPCVAFRIGGMPDIIDHQQNGYLAEPYAIEDLAKGITWVLEDSERHSQLSYSAREKAEKEFSLEIYARRYQDLFQEVMKYEARSRV